MSNEEFDLEGILQASLISNKAQAKVMQNFTDLRTALAERDEAYEFLKANADVQLEAMNRVIVNLRTAAKQALEALNSLFSSTVAGEYQCGGVTVWSLGGSYAPQEAIKVLNKALNETN